MFPSHSTRQTVSFVRHSSSPTGVVLALDRTASFPVLAPPRSNYVDVSSFIPHFLAEIY
jgi:hypothetical protein